MEIAVTGKAEANFSAERVAISLTFESKEKTYEKVLKVGTDSVVDFINKVLAKIDMKKEDLKTQSFRITETYKSGSLTGKRVPDGYKFVQVGKIKLGYEKKKIVDFINLCGKLDECPSYSVSFEVKDEEIYKNKLLKEAYDKAKATAEAIATAAGLKLKKCAKVDYNGAYAKVVSNSRFTDNDLLLNEGMFARVKSAPEPMAQNMFNTFTPEDIIMTQTVNCLWFAE